MTQFCQSLTPRAVKIFIKMIKMSTRVIKHKIIQNGNVYRWRRIKVCAHRSKWVIKCEESAISNIMLWGRRRTELKVGEFETKTLPDNIPFESTLYLMFFVCL